MPLGIAVGTPIQAGFYTAVDNGLADWRGSQYGFYFVIGCIAVAMLLVFTWLPASKPNDDLATELGAEGGEGGDSPMEQEKTTEVRRAT
ncbi:hypothetical protein QFC19_003894 [Naganishia cerealis]|uniref:Uncharacterized protein n=1 Tax=Naganishia cerealis TaxID=610337 RepID=A0ACC2VZB7_9TREE|nr:hypothetical protein QFC19_003894 [Naganishia cerealis]